MDKDVTRVSVERAAATLTKIKKRVHDTIPYGPSKVRMTPSELRDALKNAQPGALQQIMSYLGPEQTAQLLLGSRLKRAPSLDEFMEERRGAQNTTPQ